MGLAGVDELREELARRRAEHDAPHAVTAGDVDVLGGGAAHERSTIGGDRAGADPFVLAVVQVDAGHHLAGLVDDRLDAPRVEGLVRAAELHGAGDAEPSLVGGARHAVVRQVDGVLGGLLGLHGEGVAAAGLHEGAHAVIAGQRRQPGAGGDDDGVGLHPLAGVQDHGVAVDADHLRSGADHSPTLLHGAAQGLDVGAGFDEALPVEAVGAGDGVGEHGGEGLDVVQRGERGLLSVAHGALDLPEESGGLRLLLEADDEGPLAGPRVDAAELEFVEGGEGLEVDRGEGGHRGVPGPGGGLPHEAGEESPQPGVEADGHGEGGVGVEKRGGPVAPQAGVRQRDRLRRGQPAGVAPGRAGGHPLLVHDGDVVSAFLQVPGSGEADHACSDDNDSAHAPYGNLCHNDMGCAESALRSHPRNLL